MFDSRYFAYCTISALLVMSPGATMAVVLKTAVEEGRSAALFAVAGVNLGNSTLALSSALGMAILFARWPLALGVVKVGGAVYLTYLGVTGLARAWSNNAGLSAHGSSVGTGRNLGLSPLDVRLGGGTQRPEPGQDRLTTHFMTWRGWPRTGPPRPPRRAVPRGKSLSARGRVGLSADRTRHAGHETSSSVGWRTWVARGVMTNLLNPPVILFYMTFLPQFIGPADPFFRRFLVLAATHISMSLVWLSIYAVSLGTLSERMTRPGVRRAMETATGVVLIGFGVRLFLR